MSVTRLERHLNTLEDKDILSSSDVLAIECLLEKVEALDVEYKEHHYAGINLVGDDEHVIRQRTSRHG